MLIKVFEVDLEELRVWICIEAPSFSFRRRIRE
jgi:hypothetical protein